MSTVTQTQIRRGTAAQIALATGATGEIWYGLDNFHLYTNDGNTQGGYLVALYSDIPTNYVNSGLLQQTGSILYKDITGLSGAFNTAINNTNNNLNTTGITLFNLINGISFSNILYTSGYQIITGSRLLSGFNYFEVWGNPSNVTPIIYATGAEVKLSNGNVYTFSSSGLYLIDSFSVTGLNWGLRTLYDSLQTGSINWNSRTLVDNQGVQVINWNNKQLNQNVNNMPILSLDWGNQILTGKWYVQSGHITESLKLTPYVQPTGTVFLGNNPYYIYTGNTSGVFVLPPINSNTGKFYFVKNRGQNGYLSGQGSDMLFSYAPVQTSPFNSGDAYILANDGIYWNIM